MRMSAEAAAQLKGRTVDAKEMCEYTIERYEQGQIDALQALLDVMDQLGIDTVSRASIETAIKRLKTG